LSVFIEKQHQKREKIKERELFTHLQNQSICPGSVAAHLQNQSICPGSVAAYHPSLSSLGLGFKFRPGRFFNFYRTYRITNQGLVFHWGFGNNLVKRLQQSVI